MKKIDLHIPTIPTISDSGFTFSLDTFKRYVDEARLDAVAITNHDMFDGVQFRQIYQSLDAIVFPGITNLTGHPGLEPGSCIGATFAIA